MIMIERGENDGHKVCNPAGRAVGIHQGMTEQSCDNIHQSDTDNINGQVNEISFQRIHK